MKSPWAKFDQLGGLVDEDEAEGDQAVDAADGETVQDELQDDVQRTLSIEVRRL